MDEIDIRLIEELAENARRPSVEIAKRLGISDATARRRISRLIEKGTIQPTIKIKASELGYNFIAIIALEVDMGSIYEVEELLMGYENVRYVADCTGAYDVFIGAWFHSSHEMAEFFKDKLAKVPAIRKSETFVILDVKKDEIGWLQRK